VFFLRSGRRWRPRPGPSTRPAMCPNQRSSAERVNGRLKDEFGRRHGTPSMQSVFRCSFSKSWPLQGRPALFLSCWPIDGRLSGQKQPQREGILASPRALR
jgi:hypothetical protein